jgi:hypothetical protein
MATQALFDKEEDPPLLEDYAWRSGLLGCHLIRLFTDCSLKGAVKVRSSSTGGSSASARFSALRIADAGGKKIVAREAAAKLESVRRTIVARGGYCRPIQ